ncbi:ABC transporter permease [Mesorhizobium sp. M7A.F.Ca.CA.001.09.2.1]|uniref:ABC transporter permease n=1 Tax=Mesorhizobium ciceri TaxID=39645 RepID=A0AB38TEJ2_9HYPH|nr:MULTISPECIES: ABC transporter permease [Mesorhizobium]RUY46505.1 ABC transporter permease [Mesorhizobium sp. M7A.F.Ca.CA.001.13.2.1]MDF3218266.1 ABC transporter permease [Mesorhizobium ciceri]RUY71322.1 ABC transporter permease [Mesorhizobium sp. M7A.F.Ca.CA.001.13.1.1]RUY74427.1 ABC transporter permease [Mesorhizobium sp. M7A.F.Ca.CA.001.05.1.1]RUY80597.1 ABC transporter permease [Mesorhizobium sp. M7A.F.Ca.CA.001.09.2.1]
MAVHLVQRLLMIVGVVLGVVTIMFVLSRVLAPSPAELMLGQRPSAEMTDKMNDELGLNRPLAVQYLGFIGNVLRGELGNSLLTKRPVLSEVGERFGATFELTTLAMVIVLLIGIPIGVLSAVKQNSIVDNVVRTASVAGVAVPSFILAMSLQLLFYGALGWLPLQGRVDTSILLGSPIRPITGLFLIDAPLTGNWEGFMSALAHIALPLLTLTILLLATVTRITRNMMIEVLKEEYIRTAFAYGLPKSVIYYRYALKATLIPILTVVGLTYGFLLGGAVVVESVFDWPGLGAFVVSSIAQNDYPASLGATLFLAGTYLLVNLIVDLLYAVVDPRLRTA